MHLAIDVREAFQLKPTGKGQWARGFLSELLRREIPLTLFTDAPLPKDFALPPCAALTVIAARGLRWHLRVASYLRAHREITYYVSPTSYLVPALLGSRMPTIPIIHDLIAFRGEPHDRRATMIERLTLPRIVRTASHLCTVSETTKRDLLVRFPLLDSARVTPIFAGPLQSDPNPNTPDDKTILCVATLCPRKNQERLIRAFASLPDELRKRHCLLLIGARGWLDGGILRLARSTPGVEWRDYVPDAAYEVLLGTCTVFALPSLYEGFGLQILDALRRGIPLLTSDRGSLREVAGEAAVYCDPEDVGSIAEGLARLLQDPGLRRRLATAGPSCAAQFSWKRTVDLFLEVIGATGGS